VRDAGEATFEEESDVFPLYEANEFRTSDHDPVIIGLNLMAYDFDGFYPPVENPPVVNVVRAGSAVPIQFSLNGDRGLDVFFDGYPIWTTVACDGTIVGETVGAGNSSLEYDPETDTYTYVWKTDKSWRDTCIQLVVLFRDGTYRVATFMFKP
jgi:hypothetical protein